MTNTVHSKLSLSPTFPSPHSSAVFKSAYWQDMQRRKEASKPKEEGAGLWWAAWNEVPCVRGENCVTVPRITRPTRYLVNPCFTPLQNGQSCYLHFRDEETGLREAEGFARVTELATITLGLELQSLPHSWL